MSSIARHSWGGLVQAPIMSTILGCLYLASMLTSLLNSYSNCSLMLGLNTFFIATSNQKQRPRWMVLKPPIDISSPTSKSDSFSTNTPFTASLSASHSTDSTLFCLALRAPVVRSGLKPVSHPSSSFCAFCAFFYSTNQLGVQFFLTLPGLTAPPPSKQLVRASWRLSPNLRDVNPSNFLLRGLPFKDKVARKGICEISSGKSVSALLSRMSTLSRSSSLISGSTTPILLSLRLSSSKVRIENTSLGMQLSYRWDRSRSFRLLRLAWRRQTDNSVIAIIQQLTTGTLLPTVIRASYEVALLSIKNRYIC